MSEVQSTLLDAMTELGALLPAQPVVIDCRGHMLGRLASVLAKQLLRGQYVVSGCCNPLDSMLSRNGSYTS